VELTASDLTRLGPDEFLNDSAIDYYLRWLQQGLQERDPGAAERCYFFNSFFYKKLTEKNGERSGEGSRVLGGMHIVWVGYLLLWATFWREWGASGGKVVSLVVEAPIILACLHT